jgi:hypothetical protein
VAKDYPQLWRYADHRKRADELIRQGKPLSIHFNGEMYVYDGMVYCPLWYSENRYVWTNLPLVGGASDMQSWWQTWRRRKALR